MFKVCTKNPDQKTLLCINVIFPFESFEEGPTKIVIEKQDAHKQIYDTIVRDSARKECQNIISWLIDK